MKGVDIGGDCGGGGWVNESDEVREGKRGGREREREREREMEGAVVIVPVVVMVIAAVMFMVGVAQCPYSSDSG
jgi:hypothetical protein